MTVTVANTGNTNTFDYWRNRTNELAYAMTTYVVTTNSNTAVGNAAITGSFTSDTLSVGNTAVNVYSNSSSITLSNSTVSFSLTKPTAAQVSSGLYYLNANNTWTSLYSPSSNSVVTTTGTSAQIIDSYAISSYNAAEYVISVNDNNNNNYSVTKLMSFHDTGNAYVTEYSLMYSNSTPGTFSANANSTHVRIYFAPTSSNTTTKIARVIV
ncbi:hypothetical protein UFOVP787_122 [uncultured Caudovirales phage]|uniref:Uncharacterized protein n=1 Tax=uncultured Caudovirales phage TaxID=2100421 RepID=A0A6J5NVI7_9CAUD|nr:hypothetical protein UFOVP787_122 [uncultured Caudovirales phage]